MKWSVSQIGQSHWYSIMALEGAVLFSHAMSEGSIAAFLATQR